MGEPDPMQVLGQEVREVAKEFRTGRICQTIKPYDGTNRSGKGWLKDLEKAKLSLELPDNRAKMLAYETSSGLLSDEITRHLTEVSLPPCCFLFCASTISSVSLSRLD